MKHATMATWMMLGARVVGVAGAIGLALLTRLPAAWAQEAPKGQEAEAAQEPPERWSAELGLAMNSSRGNEQLTSLTSDIGLAHLETSAYELSFRGRVRYGRSDGVEVARNVRGTLNADFRPGQVWSPFVIGTAEHDPFRRLDLRAGGGVGLKRTIWRDGWSDLSLSGAVLYEFETRAAPDGVATATTRQARWSWRGRARHQLRGGARMEQIVFYQPVWDSPTDFLIESRTSARLAMSERLALTTTVLYQRDSTPPPEVARDDWSFTVGLSLATTW